MCRRSDAHRRGVIDLPSPLQAAGFSAARRESMCAETHGRHPCPPGRNSIMLRVVHDTIHNAALMFHSFPAYEIFAASRQSRTNP